MFNTLENFIYFESERKWKWKTFSRVWLFATPQTVHSILQARILEWVVFPFSRGSSQPRDRTQVSWIAGSFFTSWATKEAQEYWSGSLSLLQGIFPTQKSNQGLLNCRWILYKLKYEGSPHLFSLNQKPSSVMSYLQLSSEAVIHSR